ncbi:cell division protein SepF [Faecalimonas sp.]
MGVLDKFLNIMKLDDDYDEEEDFLEEDFEEYEEKPKKSFFKRDKEEFENFDLQEEGKSKSSSVSTHTSNKVTPMRQPNGKRAASMEVCVIKPTAVDDAREITETLLSGRTVILNLEGIDLEVAQRIIDFTSGATYAISGNLQKISNYIFLVTPTNVEISGDLQDLLNTSFDVPSIRTRF